jgi:hypothetical protein
VRTGEIWTRLDAEIGPLLKFGLQPLFAGSLSRDDIIEMVRLFLPDTANQVKLSERVDSGINRALEMGFLRRLRGTDDRFEVRRILKAFVDAQWLADFERRLATYQSHSLTEATAAE